MIHRQTKVLQLENDIAPGRIHLSWPCMLLRLRHAIRNNDLLDYGRIRTALLFLVWLAC
jgi:hypothetical protein